MLAVWQQFITDSLGNVISGADVNVYQAGTTTAVSLFSDQAGNTSLGNPAQTGADGYVKFYVAPGRYDIVAEKNGQQATFEDVMLLEPLLAGPDAANASEADLIVYRSSALVFDKVELGELKDVDFSSEAPAAGDVLAFDHNNGIWYPLNIVLDDLNDVDTTTEAPGDNDVLAYDSGSATWFPTTLSLQYPSDVENTDPADGDILEWNDFAAEWQLLPLDVTNIAYKDEDETITGSWTFAGFTDFTSDGQLTIELRSDADASSGGLYSTKLTLNENGVFSIHEGSTGVGQGLSVLSDNRVFATSTVDAASVNSFSVENVKPAGADGDTMSIDFDMPNDGGAIGTVAQVYSKLIDATAGSGDASINLAVESSDVLVDLASFAPSEITFNEPGNDVDFRVEASGKPNALFVQGSDGNVGIGTDSPDAALDVQKSSVSRTYTPFPAVAALFERSGNCDVEIITDSSSNCKLSFGDEDAEDQGGLQYSHDNDELSLRTNGTQQVYIDSNGNVGIGTSTPSETLEVIGTALFSNNVTVSRSGGASTGFKVQSTDDTAAVLVEGLDSNDNSIVRMLTRNMDGTGAGNLEFDNYEDAFFLGAGNVGIGTSTPDALLDVAGDAVIGSPTGGPQGSGTLNAEAIYDDGTQLTDYVFDKYLGSQSFEYTDEVRQRYDDLDATMFDPAVYAHYWRTHHKLPGMPDLDDVIDGKVKVGHGNLIQRLMETVELQAIHIEHLRQQVEDRA